MNNYASAVKRQIGKEVKQVAYDLDYSREQVYKLISDTYSSHPVKKTGDLAASTDSHAVAKYIATRSGGHVIPQFDPNGADPKHIIPAIAVRCAKLLETLGKGLEDGVLDINELDKFTESFDHLAGEVVGFVDHVKEELRK